MDRLAGGSSSASVDMHQLARMTCRQAFSELVIRSVHFRCFGTGRKFVIDASHLLLRSAGHELANDLLRMATCINNVDATWMADREDAARSIVQLMAAWQCIMTMTSSSFGRTDISEAFEKEIVEVSYFDFQKS